MAEIVISASTEQSKMTENVISASTGQSKMTENVISASIGQSKMTETVISASIGQSKMTETVISASIGQSKMTENVISASIGHCKMTENVISASIGQAIFLFGYTILGFVIGIWTPIEKHKKNGMEKPSALCVESKTDPKFAICPYQKEDDLYVSGSIRDTGIWDSDLTRLLKVTISFYESALVIDLEAFVGYFTFYAGALGHDVLSVEPFKSSFKRLKQGLALNEFPGTIKLLNKALSNKRSFIRMGKNQKLNLGNMQVDTDEYIDERKVAFQTDMIETVTMNDLSKYIHSAKAIVKMDIEGYECKAIEMSSKCFQELFVPYIFMDWFIIRVNMYANKTACAPEAARNLVNYLVNQGYTPVAYHQMLTLLDPDSCLDWEIDNILWQHKNATSLLAL